VTALLGNIEFVARHGAEPEVLSDLQRDADRLARLVDDLLVLERAGAGAGAGAELTTVDLSEVVSGAVNGHADGRVAAERIDWVAVRGERGALARMLENLIDNAIVHGPAEGRVTVSLVGEAERVLLTVRDEGPGPDAAMRERLFERFWRSPAASERPGSGLGLSIVAAIAEQHDGRVSVDGSAFTVSLPRVRDLKAR
jgi:signal transduction histidine kinase